MALNSFQILNSKLDLGLGDECINVIHGTSCSSVSVDGEDGMLLKMKSLTGVELERRVPASGTPLTIKELCKNLAENRDREIIRVSDFCQVRF